MKLDIIYTNIYSAYSYFNQYHKYQFFNEQINNLWEELREEKIKQNKKITLNEKLNVLSEYIFSKKDIEKYISNNTYPEKYIIKRYRDINFQYLLVCRSSYPVDNCYGELVDWGYQYLCILVGIGNLSLLSPQCNTHEAFKEYSACHYNYGNTNKLMRKVNEPFYNELEYCIKNIPSCHAGPEVDVYWLPNIYRRNNNKTLFNFVIVNYNGNNIVVDYIMTDLEHYYKDDINNENFFKFWLHNS